MALSLEVLAAVYLACGCLFILALKGLTHPSTARRGLWLGIVGMVVAVVATLLSPRIEHYGLIAAGVALGAVIGVVVALRIRMTAMPQLVALLHSFVGLAAVLVAVGTFINRETAGTLNNVLMVELIIGTFIGAITFTGSLIAFGKLQGLLSGNPVVFFAQHWLNLALFVVMLGFCAWFFVGHQMFPLLVVIAIALALGVLLIIPIGGADMPVVVSMLNSYSGWTAAAMGFTLDNTLMIVVGALVGFAGAILSYIMCRAMNRSFISVILGGFGGEGDGDSAMAAAAEKGIRAAAPEDAAFMMLNAMKLVIVPGYGMAVAQAQHALKELVEELEKHEVEVKFAIHPVAGRMPGHMNVLLAEADIPYDQVFEMEEINPELNTTDVALVVGANDITNPAAKTDRSSPIFGMPIIEVSRAKQVFVIKRSMSPGYAGVDNLLYYQDNCSLVFGDAKAVCEALVSEVRTA